LPCRHAFPSRIFSAQIPRNTALLQTDNVIIHFRRHGAAERFTALSDRFSAQSGTYPTRRKTTLSAFGIDLSACFV
jgi:hypothetical protein